MRLWIVFAQAPVDEFFGIPKTLYYLKDLGVLNIFFELRFTIKIFLMVLYLKVFIKLANPSRLQNSFQSNSFLWIRNKDLFEKFLKFIWAFANIMPAYITRKDIFIIFFKWRSLKRCFSRDQDKDHNTNWPNIRFKSLWSAPHNGFWSQICWSTCYVDLWC